MTEDAFWYEAAFVSGITNALNVAADGLIAPGATPLISPVDRTDPPGKLASVYREIQDFYDIPEVPLVFQILGRDPIYLSEFWDALQRAFSANRLSRRLKEALAFAVSLTTRSSFGTPFHLNQLRRFGVTDRGVMEV